MPRLRALLASARIANVPSVVSNVWLGAMLGWFYWANPTPIPPSSFSQVPTAALLLCLACVLIYLAGNFLNDWHDRHWDGEHRPQRALPAGHFLPPTYLTLAILLIASGLGLAFLADRGSGAVCLGIVLLITCYTILHKQAASAVFAVAGCRALLLVAGFLIADPPNLDAASPWSTWRSDQFPPGGHQLGFVAMHALGVFAWTAGLSLSARYEALGDPPRGPALLSKALLFVPIAAMSCYWLPRYPLATLLGMIPLLLWLVISLTKLRSPLPRFVAALLAGFPLVDLISATPMALALVPPGETLFGSAILTITICLPPLAFILGLALQRLAPAT